MTKIDPGTTPQGVEVHPGKKLSSARFSQRLRFILLGLAIGLVILIVGLWLYAQVEFEPAWARSVGLLGPLATETDSPRLMEGTVYMNFEGATFTFCANVPTAGGEQYDLSWKDDRFELQMEILAAAQGWKRTSGYSVYVRFTGQRAWLKNAGMWEGFGNNGLSKQAVIIIDLIDLQPEKKQCFK